MKMSWRNWSAHHKVTHLDQHDAPAVRPRRPINLLTSRTGCRASIGIRIEQIEDPRWGWIVAVKGRPYYGMCRKEGSTSSHTVGHGRGGTVNSNNRYYSFQQLGSPDPILFKHLLINFLIHPRNWKITLLSDLISRYITTVELFRSGLLCM